MSLHHQTGWWLFMASPLSIEVCLVSHQNSCPVATLLPCIPCSCRCPFAFHMDVFTQLTLTSGPHNNLERPHTSLESAVKGFQEQAAFYLCVLVSLSPNHSSASLSSLPGSLASKNFQRVIHSMGSQTVFVGCASLPGLITSYSAGMSLYHASYNYHFVCFCKGIVTAGLLVCPGREIIEEKSFVWWRGTWGSNTITGGCNTRTWLVISNKG